MKQINQAGLCRRGCHSPRLPAGWDLEVAARPGLRSWGPEMRGQGCSCALWECGQEPRPRCGGRGGGVAGRAGLRSHGCFWIRMPRHTWPESRIRVGECRDPAWGIHAGRLLSGSPAGVTAWGNWSPSLAAPGLALQQSAPEPSLACRWGRSWRGEGSTQGHLGASNRAEM